MITRKMFEYQNKFLKSQMGKYPKDMKTLHLVFCTHLAHEVHELMDCIPWKFHRNQEGKTREDLVEEAVDCAKLLMNVLILHKVSVEEFYTHFELKSKLVEERFRKEDENAAQR